jgi:hypothetical protein
MLGSMGAGHLGVVARFLILIGPELAMLGFRVGA